MKEIVDVNTGEVAIRRGKYILRAMAIGSCVVVSSYDSKAKIAGMAHIMLPGCAPEKTPEKTKYAADGIEQMLTQMLKSGCKIEDIQVCLIGGGNVLQKEDDTICADNIKSVTEILEGKFISVEASVIGGYKRKSAFLDAETGSFSFTESNDIEKPLWQSQEKIKAGEVLKGG